LDDMTLHTNRSNASLLDQLAQRCKDTCFCSFGDEIGLRLFPDSASAGACVSYITNSMSHGAEALPACLVRKHKITFDGSPTSRHDCQHGRPAPLWAVVYPESARASAASFWRLTGLGISSRQSEACHWPAHVQMSTTSFAGALRTCWQEQRLDRHPASSSARPMCSFSRLGCPPYTTSTTCYCSGATAGV
jgi:hypothetical protein